MKFLLNLSVTVTFQQKVYNYTFVHMWIYRDVFLNKSCLKSPSVMSKDITHMTDFKTVST